MTGRGAGTTGSPSNGKIRQSSKQYQDERIGTNLYGIPEGFEDKAQPAPPLEDEIIITGTRRARAPLDGWWRGIDFTPEQERAPAPAASGYHTPQPSSWMQNIQALGSQPQRLPTYNELLALENARGYAWEAGPTPFERWEQQQRVDGVARVVAMTQTPLGTSLSVGAGAFGADQQTQDAMLIGGMAFEGIAGGVYGTQGLAPRGYVYAAPAGVRALDRNPLPTLSRLRVEAASPLAVANGATPGTLYVAPNGVVLQAPPGYVATTAVNGRGLVLLPAGQALGNNANIIRYGEPSARYPDGYFRYYNSHGQPLNPLTGRPGSQDTTHITPDYRGTLRGYPGEE
ncbi:MAG: hypothetical protein ABL864_08185 [Terricaulis sp.]